MINNKNNKKIDILILEDDPSIRSILIKILKKDYNVQEAENYKTFTKIINKKLPHILLLDINLPDGNGLEICKELKEDDTFKEIIIFLMTGDTEDIIIEKGYLHGADDFIRKPFIPYEIKSKISIFEKMIRFKKDINIFNISLQNQNEKLYRFSKFIQKLLKASTIDNIFKLLELFPDILNPAYLELVKNKKGFFTPIFQITSENTESIKDFGQIKKALNITAIPKKQIHYFTIKNKIKNIFCCNVALIFKESLHGYLLFEKFEPFENIDNEIISLLMDFLDIINDRSSFEDILKDKNRVYKSEINKIRKIQVSIMPHFNDVKNFNISSIYLPANELSGDFIDGYYIDDSTYQLLLCDVSGHGIASSYVGNELRTLFRTNSKPGMSPKEIAEIVNRTSAENLNELYYFTTLILLHINTIDNKITYLNGGHPPAMYFNSSTEKCKKIGQTGSLIGIFKEAEFDEIKISLNKKDCLFIYTDGINEATYKKNTEQSERFGFDRIAGVIEENNEYTSQDILHFVVSSVYEFTDYQEQEDDITAICIKIK